MYLNNKKGKKNSTDPTLLFESFIRTRQMFKNQSPAPQFLDSNAIANEFWHVHQQHPSTWTQELDLRPSTEKF